MNQKRVDGKLPYLTKVEEETVMQNCNLLLLHKLFKTKLLNSLARNEFNTRSLFTLFSLLFENSKVPQKLKHLDINNEKQLKKLANEFSLLYSPIRHDSSIEMTSIEKYKKRIKSNFKKYGFYSRFVYCVTYYYLQYCTAENLNHEKIIPTEHKLKFIDYLLEQTSDILYVIGETIDEVKGKDNGLLPSVLRSHKEEVIVVAHILFMKNALMNTSLVLLPLPRIHDVVIHDDSAIPTEES